MRLLAGTLLFTIALAATARAQIVTGSMTGTVADPNGLTVPGADVRLIHAETGRERALKTGEQGGFTISGLDAGKYNLTVSHTGFKTLELNDVNLATGERLPLGDLRMELGQVSETVSVTERGAVVQTQSAERADVITSSQVDNLPIRGRNVQDLMSLIPGVVTTNEQEGLSSTVSMFVQGGRNTMNNISFDGVPGTDMGNGNQLKITVSQDAVAEVKMLISNYQAEYGRMAGSNIQMVTKSGARQFHGLLSYFKRHEQFNANNFFNNQQGIPKGLYRYNTYTYNIGGPVYDPGQIQPRPHQAVLLLAPGVLAHHEDHHRARDGAHRPGAPGQLLAVRGPEQPGHPGARPLQQQHAVPRQHHPRQPPRTPTGVSLLKFFPQPNFSDRTISRGQFNYVFDDPNDIPKRTSTLKLDYSPRDQRRAGLRLVRIHGQGHRLHRHHHGLGQLAA